MLSAIIERIKRPVWRTAELTRILLVWRTAELSRMQLVQLTVTNFKFVKDYAHETHQLILGHY